ncbi:uncharacterized protein J7T54_001706 [Emericellopsis cladophorae]|uniref:Nuclear speckle splicing regulatory protein 1 N-terminal domain-containing protein n=1 Tax=Emericellopsis cladophorae TaxID=2686198 RepID=A0A9Q0BGL3_9HYPO|nr:uncharacterized protein J7T54_001706 [Emericellopsis cladophorae]KAI6783830.1 hypothetical protein J7T54_001706 [Emericellopsis cladophorae]
MSKPLAFGFNAAKKTSSKAAPPKRKPMFGGDDDSDNELQSAGGVTTQALDGDLDDFVTTSREDVTQDARKSAKGKKGPPSQPPKFKSKTQQPSTMFGDLSSSLTSRKNAEAAADLDSSVYEYDKVYESLKPKKHTTKEDKERKPKYMRGLMEAADVRKRDQLIAEEKKIAREREEEGDEYADKEKFVTEAYKRQQEENKKLQEEEKRKEEEEAKKNQAGGMSGFYKNLLNKTEERHSEAVKAAEEMGKDGSAAVQDDEDTEDAREEAKRLEALKEKGADIAVNEDGQVVDKRQLLKGGLNLGAKKTSAPSKEDLPAERQRPAMTEHQIGNRQARRERQSRMLAEQLEASMKRSRAEAEAQQEEVERAAKSRKTEGDISSAKERYLARKRAAEEAKKSGDSTA